MSPYRRIHRLRGLWIHTLRRVAASGTRTYRLDSGEPFVLHVGDTLSELIYTGRVYEPLETRFVQRFLRDKDTAWDIGANIGYFTALMSRAVGPSGHVVAVEPGPGTLVLLNRTVERLGLRNVQLLPCAMWVRSEVLAFQVSRSGRDAQQSVAPRARLGADAVSAPVPAHAFDDVAGSNWFRRMPAPALIKIDVEGAEPQVIDGMQKFLAAVADPPVLLIECNSEAMRALGNDPGALLGRLATFYELHGAHLAWPPWVAAEPRFFPVDGTFAVHPGLEMNVLAIPRHGAHRERALQSIEH